MNPVLLKPQSEIGSQIVVQGRMVGTAKAAGVTKAWKPRLMEAVLDSFGRLRAEADIVIVEGRGLGLGGEPARAATSPTWASPARPTHRW